MPERISCAVGDGVAHLRLIREDARNAIDPLWIEELTAAVETVAHGIDAGTVRALLITGTGPALSVGGDIGHFSANAGALDVALDAMVPTFNAALARIAGFPVPVVCAVNGALAGGALGLAHAADLVIAADDAKFATGFHRIGLSGDGASSWYLPRLIGMRRALQMLVGGRVLGADEALEWGLVSEVVPAAELQERAGAAAAELAAGPTQAFARMRAMVRDSFDVTLAEHVARENEGMRASGATADGAEGVRSFVEKRPPEFTGT